MKMKASEWLRCAATIKETWPHSPVPDDTLRAWGAQLEDLDGEHVRLAIAALARSGERFAPLPGLIRRKVLELTLDPPEFSEVLETLREVAALPQVDREWEEIEVDGEWITREKINGHPRAEALADYPLVAKFVDTITWEQVRPAVDPAAGVAGGDEARLRVKWESFVSRVVNDLSLEGLAPDSDLPALSRKHKRRAPRSMAEITAGITKQLEPGRDEAA